MLFPKMNKPIISIVIPTFNRASLIEKAIDSIRAQTFDDWELIIVDDGSTDNTFEVVHQYQQSDARIRIYKRHEDLPKGANSCRNYGFELSKGEYVKWVDSDDILQNDCLKSQVDILKADDNLQLCLGYGVFFDNETGELLGKWSRSDVSENYLLDFVLNNFRWPIGGPLWKNSFFNTSTPFNIKLKNSQEWLMQGEALVRLKTGEIHNLKKIVYLVRVGNERVSLGVSSNYYFHQIKARFYLCSKLNVNRHMQIYIQLVKQIMVFSYHLVTARIKTVLDNKK